MSMRETLTSASALKKANGWLTWFWLANFPPVIVLYFVMGNEEFQRAMLLYLALVSIWANVGTSFSGWIAGRTEVKVEQAEDVNVQGDATVEQADNVE